MGYVACLDAIAKEYCSDFRDAHGSRKALVQLVAQLLSLSTQEKLIDRWSIRIYNDHRSSYVHGANIKFEEFSVDLEGDIDLDGFMGLSDVRPGFQEIRFVMNFKSNEPKEKLDKFVEFIEKTCPVGDTLSKGVKLVNAGVVINN